METLHALQKVTAGIDVHRMIHAVTVLMEHDGGSITQEQRKARRLQARQAGDGGLAGVARRAARGDGKYWDLLEKRLCLSRTGRHHHLGGQRPSWSKHVPGRKTDMADSEWLAVLGRFGLVRGSFIPPQDLRELRLIARYRRKLAYILAAEKNRLHKVLDDAGITLGAIVSDIDGVSAQRMIAGLIAGEDPRQLAGLGLGALRSKQDDLALALDGDLSPRHRLRSATAQ